MWIPDFVLKWIGKDISEKLNLTEGAMDGTKKWYQSKTIWTSIITGLLGLYISLQPQLGWPGVPAWLLTILGAIGVYTRSTATDKIG